MKLSAAASFVLSGIMLYSIVKALEGKMNQAYIIIPATSLNKKGFCFRCNF